MPKGGSIVFLRIRLILRKYCFNTLNEIISNNEVIRYKK